MAGGGNHCPTTFAACHPFLSPFLHVVSCFHCCRAKREGRVEWNCGMELFSEFSRSSPSFLGCFCAIDRGGEGRGGQ